MKSKARQTTQKKCVALKTSVTGVVILVNSCNSCRGVAVERYATNGKSMGRQAYKINLSVIQVQSRAQPKWAIWPTSPARPKLGRHNGS